MFSEKVRSSILRATIFLLLLLDIASSSVWLIFWFLLIRSNEQNLGLFQVGGAAGMGVKAYPTYSRLSDSGRTDAKRGMTLEENICIK